MSSHEIIDSFVRRFPGISLETACADETISVLDFPELLVHAVFRRRLDLVDKLVEYGIDLRVRNHSGMSALEIAIETLDHKLVSHILDLGVAPVGLGVNGLTPLEVAIDSEVESANYDEDTTGVKHEPTAEMTRLLLMRGADKHELDGNGKTAAQFAEDRGHLAAARILR